MILKTILRVTDKWQARPIEELKMISKERKVSHSYKDMSIQRS